MAKCFQEDHVLYWLIELEAYNTKVLDTAPSILVAQVSYVLID